MNSRQPQSTSITSPFVKMLASGTLLTMGVLLARADVRYTQKMSAEGMNDGKPFSSTTTYQRPGAERTETMMDMGPIKQKTITLTLCATKELLTLDPDLKFYYAEPLVPISTETTSDKPAAKAPKATGTIISTLVSLQDLGVQTVSGAPAHAYEVTIRTQTSGCVGKGDNTSKQQIWFGHEAADGGEADGCTSMAPKDPGSGGDSCRPVMIRKGNWALYDKIMRGVPVKARYFDPEGKVQAETEASDVLRAKLSPALFQVPADYKRVSESAFQKAQQKAMMKRMQEQAKQVANAEAGDEDN